MPLYKNIIGPLLIFVTETYKSKNEISDWFEKYSNNIRKKYLKFYIFIFLMTNIISKTWKVKIKINKENNTILLSEKIVLILH